MKKNYVTRDETALTWASGINLLLAIWLFASAWALPWRIHAAPSNDMAVGVVVLVLAGIRLLTRTRTGAATWLNSLAGVWLVIAPFALHFEGQAQRWNSIITGAVIAALAMVSGGAGASRHPAS